MLHILDFALMISLNKEMQRKKFLQPKMIQRNSTANLKKKKKLGIKGQGPTNTELSNKISCTKTNDRPVMTKLKVNTRMTLKTVS